MKTIGIITEYNPFHNGHAYQIAEIKRRTGAKFVVAAMSGNFVQRGASAIVDKYARTQMALSCGVDLVIELPVLWATASAESFAMAGVTLFEKMGCIDGICFGAETDDLPLLSGISDILCREPEIYRAALTDFLKQGMSFPLARANALAHFLSLTDHVDSLCTLDRFRKIDEKTMAEILTSPNNILAMEYLKALKRRQSAITPLLLKREGTGYHDDSMEYSDPAEYGSSMEYSNPLGHNSSAECGNPSEHDSSMERCNLVKHDSSKEMFRASATGIRRILNKDAFHALSPEDLTALKRAIPESTFEILSSYLDKCPTVGSDDFSSVLGYRLLSSTPEDLSKIADIGPALRNRFLNSKYQYESFSQFCELNKSKDITYTRISRGLLHLILNISEADCSFGKQLDFIPYLRILGFKKSSAKLLTLLKGTACIPVISKLADSASMLSQEALNILNMDVSAAELYEMIKAVKTDQLSKKQGVPANRQTCHGIRTMPRNEYSRGIVLKS